MYIGYERQYKSNDMVAQVNTGVLEARDGLTPKLRCLPNMIDKSHEHKTATNIDKLAPIPAGHLERMLAAPQNRNGVYAQWNVQECRLHVLQRILAATHQGNQPPTSHPPPFHLLREAASMCG
jgi:hypothetical protein